MDHTPGFLKIVADAKTRIQEIEIGDYRKMLEAGEHPALIDVREDSEWNAGHAVGAIHVGKGVIERDIERTVPDRSTKMVLYCGGGYRSALASDALGRMGYTNVLSLNGGWRAYEASGLPVSRMTTER